MGSSAAKYIQVARADSEARTREALLDAAEEVLFELDWSRATLVLIAERAQVTKQTLLRHFESKEGLLRAAFGRAFSRVEQQRLEAPQEDISGAVRNLLDHYYELGDRALKIGTLDESTLGHDVVSKSRQLHYDWVDHAFGGYLDRIVPPQRERIRRALIVVCDVQSWAILARDMDLPRTEVQKTLQHTISQLLENLR